MIEKRSDLGKLVECTHPIVNQIRHYYTKWLTHHFTNSKGVQSEQHDKVSVQVGYCKICNKLVMSEGQEWVILEKQATIKEDQNV